MAQTTIDFGIDLGTTNSSIAYLEEGRPTVIKNGDQTEVTPSVVRVDARGVVSVGRRARAHLDIDPANTRAEFKRLMGTPERLGFDKAQRTLSPEELSAEVLKALRADARERVGRDIEAAVITVPALFELSQCEATSRAAELAGLRQTALLQEPVASAIACGFSGTPTDGFWLVYDLGGGTFDTSLMSARDGRMSVVDHEGDNFLGGKDFDWRLVQYVIDALKAEYALPELARGSTRYMRALARLKAACEEAKIELSRKPLVSIQLPALCEDDTGAEVDVDVAVSRDAYERLIQASVDRSVAICRKLLARHGLGPGSLEKLIFVGGPTMTPLIRAGVEDALGLRAETRVDPMTIVAQGAAVFAGGIALQRTSAVSAAGPSACHLQLEYPPISQDLEPYLVGRVLKPGQGLAFVEVTRDDGGWSSGNVPLNDKGGFVAPLMLKPRAVNRFTLRATNGTGGAVEVSPSELSITHGMTVMDPPLARSIGVALASNHTSVYLPKGTPLPARRTFVHRTVETLRPGQADSLLSIPVVQGESLLANRNRKVGLLNIPANGLKRQLPANSEIEVTLEVDLAGRVRAQAFVPLLEEVFEEVVRVSTPRAEPEALTAALEAERVRLNEIRTRAYAAKLPNVIEAICGMEGMFGELGSLISAATGGDADAGQQASRALQDVQTQLDAAEEALLWPELEADARRAVHNARDWVISTGADTEHRHLAQLEHELQQAVDARQSAVAEAKIDELRMLSHNLSFRQDWVWRAEFEALAADVSGFTNLPKARELVERGRGAARDEKVDELKGIVRALWALSPVDATVRARSHNSGVR